MQMRHLPLVLAVVLGGCVPLRLQASFTPQEIEVYDQKVYHADLSLCSDFANNKYHPSFDFGGVAAGALKGGGESATGALVGGPAVLAVGAAGGATSKLSDGLDAFGQERANVMKNCILEKTHRDRSALLADPD